MRYGFQQSDTFWVDKYHYYKRSRRIKSTVDMTNLDCLDCAKMRMSDCGDKAVQDTEEDKCRDDMIEVNGGFELEIIKYRNEIDVLKSAIKDRKNAIEDRKNAIEDRKNAIEDRAVAFREKHALFRTRMLKLNKEEYDMCMEDDNTEEEKAELLHIFKTKKADILHDNLDQHSTKKLFSSRGVSDSDGMVSVTVDHVIAKAAIQANKKRERE
jgi:hypothetical protein